MGSALGALTSQYAIYQYPKVFGRAGLFSPSYWFSSEVYSFSAARHLHPGTRKSEFPEAMIYLYGQR